MVEKSSDPIAAWRNMLGEWEKGFNNAANQAMEKEDFAKMMGAFTGAGSNAQNALGELMQRHLSTLNLPSRADIANVGERLQAIEGQLSQLTRMMRSLPGVTGAAPVSAPKPARTRKPAGATAAPPENSGAKPASAKGDLL